MLSVRLSNEEFLALDSLLKVAACSEDGILPENFRSLILELKERELSRDDNGDLVLGSVEQAYEVEDSEAGRELESKQAPVPEKEGSFDWPDLSRSKLAGVTTRISGL